MAPIVCKELSTEEFLIYRELFTMYVDCHSPTDKETDESWDIFIIWKINSGLVWGLGLGSRGQYWEKKQSKKLSQFHKAKY